MDNELYLLIIALVIGLGGFLCLFLYERKRERARKQRMSEFVYSLRTAFEKKAISRVEDLVVLYDAKFGRGDPDVKVYSQIYSGLEEVQSSISTQISRSKFDDDLLKRLDELRDLMEKVNAELKREQRRVPFYGTPEPERETLEDLLELTSADKEIVSGKLTKLAELISARENTIKSLGEEKGRARRLSIWGFAGTVLFGITSIALTLWSVFRT
jgi:hypothetical protein